MALPLEYDNKFWLALLYELNIAGGQAEPCRIYAEMRKYFPQIKDEDLEVKTSTGGNKWTNRIQWVRQHLAERGCIERGTYGVWKISPAGIAWLQENWRGPDADYSNVVKPAKVVVKEKPRPEPKQAKRGTADKSQPGQVLAHHQAVEVVDPVESLCGRLVETQRLSESYEAFELALREAFDFLGFEATHIGGPSDTDILLQTYLGKDSYRVVIDAKSTRSGKVTDAQINWPVLETHRKQRNADYAVVIGEDFGGGNLKRFAEQYRVTLMRTETVCDLVRLHAITPFSVMELRQLFEDFGIATGGMESLRRRHDECLRHWRLLMAIVEQVEAYNRHVPSGLLPKADNLHLILLGKVISGDLAATEAPSLQDIQDALTFLASPAVGAMRKAPGSEDAYQLVMSVDSVKRRLSALASRIGSASNLPRGATRSAGNRAEIVTSNR
ncbi:MAG: winged helix-turn-helix domain-containing protein [Chloroflexota bacterium]